MRGFLNITKKEIRELLTPAAIAPIIIMAVLFGALGNMIGSVDEETSKPPIVGIVDLDNSAISEIGVATISSAAEIVYNGSDIDSGIRTVEEKGGTALIVFPSDFSDNILNNKSGEIQIIWIMRGGGVLDSIPSGAVEALIARMNSAIAGALIGDDTSVSPQIILNPTQKNETTIFKQRELAGVSPTVIMGIVSQQSFVIPLIVLLVIVISGGTVISSMGSEKENKTLETLLTLPVKRSSIVFGKLVGAAVVGLIMAVIYMIGFGYYMSSMQQQSPIDLASYGLTLGPLDYLLVGITLFLGLFAALALCMLLGIFAKNMKSAQTLTMPITFLAIIPMFIFMLSDFDTLPLFAQVILFAIPFSHPMMVMQSLIFDNYMFVIIGIIYEAFFGLLTVSVAVWLFKKDILITGILKRDETKLKTNPLQLMMQIRRLKRL